MTVKLIQTPLIRNGLAKKTQAQRSIKKPRRRSEDLRRVTHELGNQLTVINLSCFRARALAPEGDATAVIGELQCIENAVAEIADLLAKQPPDDDATCTHSSTDPGPGGKVHPLFKSVSPKR